MAGPHGQRDLPSTDPDDPDATVEFFVQAVDAQGDVSISDNKVENFFNAGDPEGGPLAITATEPNSEGYQQRSDVTVTISAASPDDFDFVSLDGEPLDGLDGVSGVVTLPDGTAVLTIQVTGDGTHVVFARDSSGSGQIFPVRHRRHADATIQSDPVGTTAWSQGPVTVGFSVDDSMMDSLPFSSGVASITYTVGAEAGVTTAGASASVSVPTPGVTTVRALATDAAGNVSAPVEVVVRIDQTAPTVTDHGRSSCDPTEFGVGEDDNGDPHCPGRRRRGPDQRDRVQGRSRRGRRNRAATGCRTPSPFIVNTEGQAVWYRATDEALNVSATLQSATLQIDTTVPLAAVSAPSPLQLGAVATATASCSDALSGIKSSGGCVLSGDVNPATGALNTSTVGPKQVTVTAIDNVGNYDDGDGELHRRLQGLRVVRLHPAGEPGSGEPDQAAAVRRRRQEPVQPEHQGDSDRCDQHDNGSAAAAPARLLGRVEHRVRVQVRIEDLCVQPEDRRLPSGIVRARVRHDAAQSDRRRARRHRRSERFDELRTVHRRLDAIEQESMSTAVSLDDRSADGVVRP